MKSVFKRRFIKKTIFIVGTPLHTIYEDSGEENITYAEDEHYEIDELENKIKKISLHVLENIFDKSIKSEPSDVAGVDAVDDAGVDADGDASVDAVDDASVDADDDANDARSDRTNITPPTPAPRPFNTFSFATRVKILKELL